MIIDKPTRIRKLFWLVLPTVPAVGNLRRGHIRTAHRRSNNIWIRMNRGDATFKAAVIYDTGYRPTCIFPADVDSDSDLAVANYLSGDISILLNTTND